MFQHFDIVINLNVKAKSSNVLSCTFNFEHLSNISFEEEYKLKGKKEKEKKRKRPKRVDEARVRTLNLSTRDE